MGEVAGFNRATSKPHGRVLFGIELLDKSISVDIYLMNDNAPHNGLLGHN